MNPAAVLVVVLLIALPVVCHYLVREFWAASFLSAVASGTALGLLVHGAGSTWSTFLLFVFAASAFLLVPAFVVGIPFQKTVRHREYRARHDASPAGYRKRVILGTVAVALGGCVTALVLVRWLSSADELFRTRPFLGGLAFLGIGAWQLATSIIKRKRGAA